jgi:hypothetical protein
VSTRDVTVLLQMTATIAVSIVKVPGILQHYPVAVATKGARARSYRSRGIKLFRSSV